MSVLKYVGKIRRKNQKTIWQKRLFASLLPCFQKKTFLHASKGKINAKSPADAEDPPGTLPGKPPERIDLAGRGHKQEGGHTIACPPLSNKVNE